MDESRRARLATSDSSPRLSNPVYDLLRERGAGGPSICEESLNRKLDPLRDAMEEVRDKDGRSPRRHGDAPPIGDGKGVMSPIAFSWGDDMIEAGDKEPALEIGGAIRARRLGVRCGRLPDDTLSDANGSESRCELVGRILDKSVRIWSEGSIDDGELSTEGALSTAGAS